MNPMLTLFLDLASSDKIFALVGDKKTELIVPIDDQKQEEVLMETLESMLLTQHKTFSHLTHIACVVGPGGFTSLRVGVALANALSYSLDIPSTPIHLSDLYAIRISRQDFVWVHTTKKTHLFVQGFGAYRSFASEATLMKLDDLLTSVPSNAHVIGEVIPEHRERLHLHTLDRSLEETLPSFLTRKTYQKGQILMPWYGREA